MRPIFSIVIAFFVITAVVTAVVVAQVVQDKNADEVVRITTELVQTGVVVVDKQGKFVNGLRQDQFVLKVDGQPVTPAFFEQVVMGTAREEALEKGARGSTPAGADETRPTRGRSVIFFIDDLHLSAGSIDRTRKGILEFVEREMTLEDQVAIVSPSGQIGFLQRFSELKPVVRAAVNRLNYKPYTVRDHEQVPMTEYQAIRIEQGDSSTTDYFSNKLLEATNVRVAGGLGPPPSGPSAERRRTSGMTIETARRVVKDRANLLVRQSESVTGGTLSTLENLMRAMSQSPGRKVVFFVSDGFFINDRSSGYADRIRRIADAAVRGGMVVYSLDARGVVGATDASSNLADAQGTLSRSNVGELAASQDGLNALAVDTGGKAFFNSTLTNALNEALRETSNYYLLAWRPTTEVQKSANFKLVEVSIVGRPELTVRVARGFFGTKPPAEEKETETAGVVAEAAPDASGGKRVETALMSALSSPSARMGIPTKLSVSFVDVPNSGPVLTTATQIPTDVLGYEGNQPAAVDLAGVVLNDQGKQAGSFKTRLNVAQLSAAAGGHPTVAYNHKLPLKPGLYQIRVAVRDEKSGRVGSAADWIEIPDLSSKKLELSTLLLGGQFVGAGGAAKGQAEQVQFSIDRRFTRGSQMTFLTIVYNARQAGGAAKLDSQIEILRGGQKVIASPVLPIVIEPNTDLVRIPYGGGVGLKSLQPGRYILKVTVNDRVGNVSATNQILFEVE